MLIAADWGDTLVTACARATSRIVLAAPFIKEHVIRRLLHAIEPSCEVIVVTRWRPEEIKAGVSDLGVFPYLVESGSQLKTCSNLHAKYYRMDQTCWIGSANLTSTALGWTSNPNLELLIQVRASRLAQFEHDLLASSYEVDQSIFLSMTEAVACLPDIAPIEGATISESDGMPDWWPQVRHPEQLFDFYSGSPNVTTANRQAALIDLAYLKVPAGLDSSSFKSLVGAILLQAPTVQALDQFADVPRRFGEVTDFIGKHFREDLAAAELDTMWQTMMRWLRHFLPGRYVMSVPNRSEIFYRRLSD